jgi:hypothetical protein
MEYWLSHTITGVVGILAGSLPAFVLSARRQTAGEWQAIVTSQRQRIAELERRIDALHRDLARCLAVQAELRQKVASLEARSQK